MSTRNIEYIKLLPYKRFCKIVQCTIINVSVKIEYLPWQLSYISIPRSV